MNAGRAIGLREIAGDGLGPARAGGDDLVRNLRQLRGIAAGDRQPHALPA